MNAVSKCFLLGVIVSCVVQAIFGYQFRFDVPDNDEECFGQELEVDTPVTMDYRVMQRFNLSRHCNEI